MPRAATRRLVQLASRESAAHGGSLREIPSRLLVAYIDDGNRDIDDGTLGAL